MKNNERRKEGRKKEGRKEHTTEHPKLRRRGAASPALCPNDLRKEGRRKIGR